MPKSLSLEEQLHLQAENVSLKSQLEFILSDLAGLRNSEQPGEIKGRSGFDRGVGGFGTLELNVRTGIGVWSETAFKLIGLPKSNDNCESIDRWKSTIHPEEQKAFSTTLASAVEKKQPWSTTYRTMPDDMQRSRWIAVYGQFVQQEADSICSIVLFDITERKRAEHELLENRVRLTTLTDNLPDGVVFQAKSIPGAEERKLLYISRSVEKLLGISQEAFRSNPRIGFDAIIPEHRKLLADAERLALEQMESCSVEIQYRRGDELRWCKTISAPRSQPDGSVIWDGMMIDITELKLAAEAELRALRFQINPHFLFNSLSAVSTLIIDGHSEKAEQFALYLAKFYRHTLLEPSHLINLGLEVELTRSYLEMELVRFPDELDFYFDVPSELEHYLVPSMVMQPIVENSIKYGLGAQGTKLLIEIQVRNIVRNLVIKIRDNGILNNKGCGAGLGQKMTIRRLESIFGTDWSFRFGHRRFGGYEVEIRMPLKSNVY